MPLYRFLCSDCQSDFEELLSKPPVKPLPACPECQGENVSQVLGLPSVGAAKPAATNCRGDGPPCGKMGCGRNRFA